MLIAASAAAGQDPKGYLGAGLGGSKYSGICDNIPPQFSCDDTGFGGKVFAGYLFLPFLGVEGSYFNFGHGSSPAYIVNPPAGTTSLTGQADVKSYAFALSVVGRLPLGPAFIDGRAGYAGVTASVAGNAAVQNTTTGAITYYDASTRDSSGQFIYGVALGYNFGSAWTVRVDWDRTKGNDGRNPDFDVELYSLGIAYRY
jgi:hypothetical protein